MQHATCARWMWRLPPRAGKSWSKWQVPSWPVLPMLWQQYRLSPATWDMWMPLGRHMQALYRHLKQNAWSHICLHLFVFFAYVQIYNTDHILVLACFGLEFHGFSRGQRGYERWHARSHGYAQQWYSCWAMQTRNSMKCHEILGVGWYFAKCLGS